MQKKEKCKLLTRWIMIYEDASEDEPSEGEVFDRLGKETDQDGNEVEIAEDGEIETVDIEDEASKPKPQDKKTKSKSKKKRKVSAARKDYDRSIFVAAKGLDFEVHFRFTNEPHILLGQVCFIYCSYVNDFYLRLLLFLILKANFDADGCMLLGLSLILILLN